MKPRTVGALSIYRVDKSDTSGDAFCPVEGCFGMALCRVEICGWPAGAVCGKHANEFLKTWAELLEPEQVPERLAA